jgi:hypothetical protein
MNRTLLVVFLLAAAACKRDCPPAPAADPTPAAPAPAVAPAPTASLDCAAMTGQNPVQTEMRQLECALERAVIAIGRDDLPSIAHMLHIVHAAKEKTAQAITSGAWKPAQGDVTAFVAMDEAFHKHLEALVIASQAKDHAGATAALGRTLGACQGCHAAFRPVAPPPTPWPPGAAAAPPHAH